MLVALTQPALAQNNIRTQNTFATSARISAAAMKTQAVRLSVVSEYIANSNSLANDPQGQPYRRKPTANQSQRPEFLLRYNPKHPAANAKGYVRAPRINTLTEMINMREAQRSYGANLKAKNTTQSMFRKTIQSLRR